MDNLEAEHEYQDAKRLLDEAEQLLVERQLDQAAARFQALAKSPWPELRERAEKGLHAVQEEIQSFEDTTREARNQSDPRAAAETWRRAHTIWPSERNIAGNLAKALVRAGEAALSAGDTAAAATDFKQVLEIKPGDKPGLAGQKKLAELEAISASIAQARAELGQRQALDIAADDRLRAQLAEQLRATAAYPTWQQEITAFLAEIDQQQEQWGALALADQQAAALAAGGDWVAALQVHAATIAVLGEPLPALAQTRHIAWQAAWDVCTTTQQAVARLLEQARAAYGDARSEGDFTRVAAQLARIDQELATAQAQLQTLGIPLPSQLQSLGDAATKLRRRTEAAAEALDTPSILQGLSSIRGAIQILGTDPTFQWIEADLASRRGQLVPDLLLQAQAAEDQEAISDAHDFLRQAREIDPQHPGLAERLDQIERRRRFEEAVRRAEIDADVSGSSVTATRSALRRALEVFLLPDYAIPEPTRATVRELLALADREAGEALSKDEQWLHARELREQFLSRAGWADRRAAQIAEQWLLVAREAALRGAIASLAQLGDLLGSYRTAFEYRRIFQNEESSDLLERAQSNLRQRLVSQAEVLLSRAGSALNVGGYDATLDNLNRLEQEYYAPIEREFPYLLTTLDENKEISEARDDKAQALRREAEELRQRAEAIKQARETAERFFLANEFAQAEQILQGMPRDRRLAELNKSVDLLAERIVLARRQHARTQLDDRLILARIALNTEASVQQLDTLVAELEQTSRRLDWAALTEADRAELQGMIDKIGAARTSLTTVQGLEADARRALQGGDDEAALLALQRACAATLDASKRIRLETEIVSIEGRVLRQRQQQSAIDEGRRLLDQGKWAEAQQHFMRAHLAGANVDFLLRTARAGELFQHARSVWEQHSAIESVESEIDFALELVVDNPEAVMIAADIRYYHKQIKQRIDLSRNEIRQARLALARTDLAAAEVHIHNVLSWDSHHPQALELQAEQQRRATAHTQATQFGGLVDRAEQERKRGNDRAAVAFAKQALDLRPDDPIAANLHTTLTRENEANELLRQARTQIYGGKFPEAQRLIQAAEIQAGTPLLAEVKRQLEDLEGAYRANTTYPIRDLLRDERFPEALRRCREALKFVQSDLLRADLNDLAATIAERWAAQALGQAQHRARSAGEEQIFLDIAADLGKLANELAGFSEVEQIERQIRQIMIGRLAFRLDRVDRFLLQRARASGVSTTPLAPPEQAEAANTGLLSLAEARDLTKQTLLEATDMGLEQMCLRARDQIEAINERERFEQAEEAKQLFNRASSRPNEDLASEDIAKARSLLETQQRDHTTVGLLDQIDTSQRTLQETREAIASAERSLSQGHLVEARRQLRRPKEVFASLEPRYRQLEALIELLLGAEQLEAKHDWPNAFAAYSQATQQDLSLEWAQKRLDRCRQQLTDQVQAEIGRALRLAPPDPARALSLLNQADTAGWLQAGTGTQPSSLRNWITSRQRVADAIALLDSQPPDPDRALDLLNEARQLYADPASDDQLEQWRRLAQVFQFQRSGDLVAAQRAFDQIRPPVAELAIVQVAQRSIRQQMLGKQREALQRALATWDYVAAGQALEQCLALAPNDAEIQRAAIRQQQLAARAPELRQAMEAGWRTLEQSTQPSSGELPQNRCQLARQQFERAGRLDDQFTEADQWRSFAQTLERGLADLDRYGSAAHWFELAQRALTTTAHDPRPVLLGNHERQRIRRSQATETAARLATAARAIEQLLEELGELERLQAAGSLSSEQIERANAIFPAIARQSEQLDALSRRPIIAAVESM